MQNGQDLCLVDCLSGDHTIVGHSPYKVGGARTSDWRIVDDGVPDELFTLNTSGSEWRVCPSAGGKLIFDGKEVGARGVEIQGGKDHTLVCDGQYFALRITGRPEDWATQLDPRQWYLRDSQSGENSGPFGWPELAQWLRTRGKKNPIVYCKGLAMGFYAQHLAETVPDNVLLPGHDSPVLPYQAAMPAPQQVAHGLAPNISATATDHGEFTCPVCWLKFDRGDVLHIASHTELRGDAVLGETAMQRFTPTQYDDRGHPLDDMGVPSLEQACPHCRRALPSSFLDMPHYILSIVGAPSAGKSYYLSVLIKTLQSSLFHNFGVTVRDADPSSNVILNQMKAQLFSAGSPQDAVLAKTDLEGALYETLPRRGRIVRLPRPFTFKLSGRDSSREGALVFYDNAGEHFEPTRNSADSPGAQHIAVASGIFFLFDPLHSSEFRRVLRGVSDPQLLQVRVDQQDVILAETEVRIKSLLRLESRARLKTPLAVMVGKCDTWLSLLGPDPLQPVIIEGKLSLGKIKENSSRIRKLMAEIAPAIVGNAEAISSNVEFFALSSLGSSPVEFIDRDGSTKIGPDPSKLNPQFVEVPTLWVLSHLMPDLVPSTP